MNIFYFKSSFTVAAELLNYFELNFEILFENLDIEKPFYLVF
jgi:hypothetical protein